MKSVKGIIAGILICVSLLLCACGSKTAPEDTEKSAAPTANTVEEVIKKPGGDLFIAMPAEIESFDPLIAESDDLINLLTLIYETPLKYDVSGRILPNLIESWEVDESGTQFTFKLRQDAYFSDGTTKLSSADIIYSAEKVMELDGFTLNVGSSGAAEDGDTAGDGENTGDEQNTGDGGTGEDTATPDVQDNGSDTAYSRYGRFSQNVQSISAPDESTVVLKMKTPGNAALNFMTFPVMSETLSTGEVPVGTGPYKVQEYKPGEEMSLVKNDSWWQQPPYIEKIVAKAAESYTAELDYVEASIIDFATTDVLYSSKYRKPGKTQVTDYMTNYYDCLIPNLITDELKDVNVRQAISYALDRREILSTVLLNHGVPTNLPIAPDFFAYDSRYKISDFDSGMARELLHESGYVTDESGEGKKLSLDLIVLDERNGAYKKEAAKAVKKQLGELYIEVNIEELPYDEYMKRLQGGNYDLAYCSFYLDIVPELSFMFDQGGSGNYGHVQSEEITNAIAACSKAVTEEEMTAAYSELQKVLTERVPQIGLYFRMNSIINDESIKDIKDARQNMVFSTVSQWYSEYFAEVEHKDIAQAAREEGAAQASASASAQSAEAEQTQPEATPETSPTPSAEDGAQGDQQNQE